MRKSYFTKLPLPVAVAAVLTACGSSSPEPDESQEDVVLAGVLDDDLVKERVICKRQRPLGTHVAVKVCKTESQIEAERKAAQDSMGMLRTISGDNSGMETGSQSRN